MNRIDPKAAGGAFGAAVATLVWTLLAVFNPDVQAMSAEALASVTGATATIVAALVAYFVPNSGSKDALDGVVGDELGDVEADLPEPDDPDPHEGTTSQ